MDDFKLWYNQQPIVTRTSLSIVLLTSFLCSFGVISPNLIYIDFEKLQKFHLWRLVTNFFFAGTFKFDLIWTLFFLHFALSRVESLFTRPKLADQLWLYVFLMVVLNILGLITSTYLLQKSLTFALIYIWCKRRPFEIVSFMFGMQFKSAYFPFILMGFHLLTGQSFLDDLLGLAAGHAYVFLKDILAIKYRKDYIATPQFFQQWFNQPEVQRNNQMPQQGGFRPFGGQGVRMN